MKRVLLLLYIASLTSCQKVKSLADINVDLPYSTVIDIPPNSTQTAGSTIPGGLQITLPGYAFATNVADYTTTYNTSTDKINAATLKSMILKINAPAGANFDFLDTIRIYMSAPGQPVILAGHKYGIPKSTDSFALDVTPDNLKAYLIQDSIRVSLSGFINAVPAGGMKAEVATVFHLFANPLN